MDGQILFGRPCGPQVAGEFFKATPDDAFSEFFSRGDVPDQLVGCVYSSAE